MNKKIILLCIVFLLLPKTKIGKEFYENQKIQNIFKKTCIYFIPNKGQLPKDILFSTFPASVFIMKDKIIINQVEILFKNANRNVKIKGINQRKAKFSYFKGNQPNKWKNNIPSYEKILFQNLYPGIDLIFTGLKNCEIELQWIIKPYSNPEKIKFEIKNCKILKENNSIKAFKNGKILFRINEIKAFQGAEKIDIKLIKDKNEFWFKIGKYNPEYSLIIDPGLDHLLASTYLGGEGNERGNSIIIDKSGNVFLTGYTESIDFPIVGGYDSTYNDSMDVFIAKFNSSLDTLLASTYLGGVREDEGLSIALDSSGNVFLTGCTGSSDFPIVNGYDSTYNGCLFDAFVAKLNNSLDSLLASTFLGGSWGDWGNSIIIDDSNNVFIAGWTGSPEFPIVGGYDSTYNGYGDVFVAKMNNSLNSLLASTFLGGSENDEAFSIIIDDTGNVFLTGKTASANFPIIGGYDPSFNGNVDVFVAKLNHSLNSLLASTYLGGGDVEEGNSIAIDNSQNIFITGYTQSPDFPIVGGYDPSFNGYADVFIAKLNNSLDILLASTFLGGSEWEVGNCIYLNNPEDIFVIGVTYSSDFPIVEGYDSTLGGEKDVFIAKLNNSISSLLASTYLGGNGREGGRAIFLDNLSNVFLSGGTGSQDFPIVEGYDSTYNGGSDVFIAKMNADLKTKEIFKKFILKNSVRLVDKFLIFEINKPCYLGFDIIGIDGRIIERESIGFISKGKYKYRLNLRNLPHGIYILKIRTGEKIKNIKIYK